MTRDNPAEQQETQEKSQAQRTITGEHAVLVVPRSFSFEVLPEVAERVIQRTEKYLRSRESRKPEQAEKG